MSAGRYTGFDAMRAESVELAAQQSRLSKSVAAAIVPTIEQVLVDAVAESIEAAKAASQKAGIGSQWSVTYERDGLDRLKAMTITRVK